MTAITKEAKDALKEKIKNLFISDKNLSVHDVNKVLNIIGSMPEMKMPNTLDLINATKFYANVLKKRSISFPEHVAEDFSAGADFVINYMKGEVK